MLDFNFVFFLFTALYYIIHGNYDIFISAVYIYNGGSFKGFSKFHYFKSKQSSYPVIRVVLQFLMDHLLLIRRHQWIMQLNFIPAKLSLPIIEGVSTLIRSNHKKRGKPSTPNPGKEKTPRLQPSHSYECNILELVH